MQIWGPKTFVSLNMKNSFDCKYVLDIKIQSIALDCSILEPNNKNRHVKWRARGIYHEKSTYCNKSIIQYGIRHPEATCGNLHHFHCINGNDESIWTWDPDKPQNPDFRSIFKYQSSRHAILDGLQTWIWSSVEKGLILIQK